MSYNNILCPIHKSPIGGVCNEISCKNKNHLLCMNCVSNANSCIRKLKHEFIPFDEFINNHFNIFLQGLKSSVDTSQRINTIEQFCNNAQSIYDNFNAENEKIGSDIINIFQGFLDKINQLFIKFNQDFISFIKTKENELNTALNNLIKQSYFDKLEGFDQNALTQKIMSLKDFNSLNNLIGDMKKCIVNLGSDMTVRDIEKVKEIININGEKVIKYFRDEFNVLENESIKRFNLYNAKIKEKMFSNDINYPSNEIPIQNLNINNNTNNNYIQTKTYGKTIQSNNNTFNNSNVYNQNNNPFNNNLNNNNIIQPPKISVQTFTNINEKIIDSNIKDRLAQYNCIYESPIDYTSFSNFPNKKFIVFEHSNGKTLFAYPTSNNTINIEFLDSFIEDANPVEPITNATFNKSKQTKSNIFNPRPQKIDESYNKINNRQKYLYFTLSSHSSKINEIIYYRSDKNKDYLISSSDDGTIKIWEITNLEKYFKDASSFYRTNCIKTLTGHQGRIVSLKTYYDPLKAINYIISLGYGDKIKVWNLVTGQLIKDIYDFDNFSQTIKDSFMEIANINKVNYLFTANGMNNKISIWDFESGEIIKQITYSIPDGTFGKKKIVALYYFNSRLYIIDDIGPCGYIDLTSNDFKLINCNFKLSNKNDVRIGVFPFFKGAYLCIYCKNGEVYQYDFETNELCDQFKMGNKGTFISYAMEYMHHTKREIIILHCGDYHIKIFN